jgi:2-hydroxychromene-2-carboxylate isomerase
MHIEFWFEFASTYSYPAAMRVESLAASRGIKVIWRSFLLGPIFHGQGWNDSPFNVYPSKGRYMWRDVERICSRLKIPFQRPALFPQNGLLAARIACRFAEESWLPEFVRAVYRANFADGLDISSRDTVDRCLSAAGQPNSSQIIEEAQSQSSKDLLRSQSESAQRAGIFGAPSFLVDGELFWGNDRLEEALDWRLTHSLSSQSR